MTAEFNLEAVNAQTDTFYGHITRIQIASAAVALSGFALLAYLLITRL